MSTRIRKHWSDVVPGSLFDSFKIHDDFTGAALLRRDKLESERLLSEEWQELVGYYYMHDSIKRMSTLKKVFD